MKPQISLQTHRYSLDHFPFHRILGNTFNCPNLMLLHEKIVPRGCQVMAFDYQPGEDQATLFHKQFYAMVDQMPDGIFMDTYRRFAKYVKSFVGEGEFLYQRIPTFRVHLPNNKAVGGISHRDSDYNHPKQEINIIVPLTSMFGTNSMFTETRPHLRDFRLVQLDVGQFLIFNGANCEHGNFINTTGITRVSFDFRLLPKSAYNPEKAGESVAHHIKFLDGHYYAAI
jgi:hypothetical protein